MNKTAFFQETLAGLEKKVKDLTGCRDCGRALLELYSELLGSYKKDMQERDEKIVQLEKERRELMASCEKAHRELGWLHDKAKTDDALLELLSEQCARFCQSADNCHACFIKKKYWGCLPVHNMRGVDWLDQAIFEVEERTAGKDGPEAETAPAAGTGQSSSGGCSISADAEGNT